MRPGNRVWVECTIEEITDTVDGTTKVRLAPVKGLCTWGLYNSIVLTNIQAGVDNGSIIIAGNGTAKSPNHESSSEKGEGK